MHIVRLAAGDATLDIAPGVGASILGFRVKGVPILRDADMSALQAAGALAGSCFAMVPWVSRIAHGQFGVGDRHAQLPPAPDGSPHALHGFGWRSAWEIAAQTAGTLSLAQAYAPPLWPWRAAAAFDIALDPRGARLDLTVTNHDDAPMPAGLGFHPYFPRPPGTRLTVTVDGVWTMDGTGFPATRAPSLDAWDWRDPDAFGVAALDNVFTGFQSPARLHYADRTIAIGASPECERLIVYAPPGADFCCVEPVTSMTDAVNRAEPPDVTGLRMLAPGETLAIWMRIDVED